MFVGVYLQIICCVPCKIMGPPDAIHHYFCNYSFLPYNMFFITFTDVDLCKSNPCLNNGTCTKGDNTYTCSCNGDYTGQKCESKSSRKICLPQCAHEHETDWRIYIKAGCGLMCWLMITTYVIDPVFVKMCLHVRLCADHCDDMGVDGTYALCEDCRSYIRCSGTSETRHQCPNKPNWGFNMDTKQCQYQSPHCFACSGRFHIWIKYILKERFIIIVFSFICNHILQCIDCSC